MARPAFELAGIFRQHGAAYRRGHPLPRRQLRVLRAVEVCRTAALGGHVEQCSQCHHTRIAYNSCRNRHCPKCQNTERERWVNHRAGELLPVEYFHVVFTVPAQIARLAFYNQRVVYSILFRAASETLLTIARDPKHLGAGIGFFAVLHTWGQNLLHHPHVHCVVPGGGLSADHQSWIHCRPGFFLPVRVLSRLFRRLFLEYLEAEFHKGAIELFRELEDLTAPGAFAGYLHTARQLEWVVYAKPPFGGAAQALEYLGRYTHRVALSNERLLQVDDHSVTFQWKDYRHQHKHKSRVMTVSAEEFIRRFLMHTLPDGFQRIRYFGFLSNRHRQRHLALCRQLLTPPTADLLPPLAQCREVLNLTVRRLAQCPECHSGQMIGIGWTPPYRWPVQPPDTS